MHRESKYIPAAFSGRSCVPVSLLGGCVEQLRPQDLKIKEFAKRHADLVQFAVGLW